YSDININLSERVIVSQLVRSTGAYINVEEDSATGKRLAVAKFIPNRGAWLEFETSTKNIISVKVDRKRKLPITTLLRAISSLAREYYHQQELDLSTNEGLLAAFAEVDNDPTIRYIQTTMERDPVKNEQEALIELYKKLRPGDPVSLDNDGSLV